MGLLGQLDHDTVKRPSYRELSALCLLSGVESWECVWYPSPRALQKLECQCKSGN